MYSVRDRFDYADGKLVWKSGPRKGKVAGSVGTNGYVTVNLDKKWIGAHRLVWAWHFGYLPDQIDHINGDRADNRIDNLRPASTHENGHNRGASRNSCTGVKGIHKEGNSYRATVMVHGVRYKRMGKDIDELKEWLADIRKDKVKEFAHD